MDVSRLSRGEWVAMVGGLLLAVSLFIAWYHVENRNAVLAGTQGPASITGFDAHSILRWLLLAAAAAPFILAWIIVRNHTLSWPRGQLTSVVAIAAFGLLFYNGVIDRPGDPSSLIGLRLGWLAALLGTLLMLSGSFMRQQETEVRRKPPGTI